MACMNDVSKKLCIINAFQSTDGSITIQYHYIQQVQKTNSSVIGYIIITCDHHLLQNFKYLIVPGKLRDRSQTLVRGGCSQTLVRGGWCKEGVLKFVYPCKIITKNFPVKIDFSCFSMGLTHNFHGKKGALKSFEVWKGDPPWKFRPPLQVFVNGHKGSNICITITTQVTSRNGFIVCSL